MGPSKSVLLVDSDARSLRVLEVSLKKAGFEVATAESASAALDAAIAQPPDLVLTETQLPDQDGFALARSLKSDPITRNAGIIFLSHDSSAEAKISAINAGSEFYLTKPVLVRDILNRIGELLERQQTESAMAQKDQSGNLSGTLANMGVVDLLQLMESGRRSGIVHLSTDRLRSGGFVSEQARGTLFFREGQVVDARVSKLAGVDAIYRMLLWDDGVFELEFQEISRDDIIDSPTQTILLEGMRRVDEWTKLAESVPPLPARLTLDFPTLSRAFPVVDDDTQSVLQLFDGQRTLLDVIDDAPMIDLQALEVIAELHSHGVLVAGSLSPSSNRENNLRATHAERVPSVLNDAMIPSPRTPSEILGLRDPRSAEEPIPVPSIVEAPTASVPSVVLSRFAVPSGQSTPGTGSGFAQEAPTITDRPTPTRPTGQDRSTPASKERFPPIAAPTPVAEALPVAEQATFEPERTLTDRPLEPAPTTPEPQRIAPASYASPPVATGITAVGTVDTVPTSAAPKTMPFAVPAAKGPEPVPAGPPPPPEPMRAASALTAVPSGVENDAASRDFFASAARSDVDIDWDADGPRWKRQLPGIMFGAAVVIGVLALVFGGALRQQTPDAAGEPDRTVAVAPAHSDQLPAPRGPESEAGGRSGPIAAAATIPTPPTVPEPINDQSARESKRLIAMGNRYLKKERYAAARRSFNSVLATNPDSAAAHAGLSMVWVNLEKDQKAQAAARRALKLDRGQAQAHLALALVYTNAGEQDKAKRYYRSFLRYQKTGKLADEVRRVLTNLP